MSEEYPLDILELEKCFPDETSCREYLFKLRWPDGFICPKCNETDYWLGSRGRIICNLCRHQTTITAGTIFGGTRKPLTLWFRAIWYVTCDKQGVSAKGLQHILGLRKYSTAWTWLHKLRRAMVDPARDRLSGVVEVDETFIGGVESNVDGRQTETKSLVIIAVEDQGRKMGRIRMSVIPDASRIHLHAFISEAVEPGSTIHSDGFQAYRGIESRGYIHKRTCVQGRKDGLDAIALLPKIHTVASLLKRWLDGTHQGAVSPKHLDYYLDEFTFRFNRRTSQYRGKLFYRLLQNVVKIQATPYREMIGGKNAHNTTISN